MACEQRIQRALQSFFHCQHHSKAQNHLQDLHPPKRLRLKIYILPLQRVGNQQTRNGTQYRIGILAAGSQIMQLRFRNGKGKEFCKQQQTD